MSVGVLLHLPMYLASADDGYMLDGMPMGGEMWLGMLLVLVGLGATCRGLWRPPVPHSRQAVHGTAVLTMDEARLGTAHLLLLLAMAAVVTVDLVKPVTLSFVLPGMTEEYGLRSATAPDAPSAALLPLAGISGTVVGSLLWGWLGDRIGRRGSILLAGVVFIGTAVCGAMPSFSMNLLMCLVMGLAVGGMLPLAFTLLAETIPRRHRSWLLVLIGGDIAGAYLITSRLAAWLEPDFG